MSKQRRGDDPDDTGARHRRSIHPGEGPLSDWGRGVVEALNGIRTDISDIRGDVAQRHEENRDQTRSLRNELHAHTIKDETALQLLQDGQAAMTAGLAKNTEITQKTQGMLRFFTAAQGAVQITKWAIAGIAALAGAVLAVATIIAVVLWMAGKGPLPHFQIGSFDAAPVSEFIQAAIIPPIRNRNP